LIAGALGVRPQRTKEQREYDKITRENEKKRIEKRKEEQRKEAEEDERAKNEVWLIDRVRGYCLMEYYSGYVYGLNGGKVLARVVLVLLIGSPDIHWLSL